MTVSEYVSSWIDLRSCGLAPRTVEGYKALNRLYVAPVLGAVDVAALDPGQVQRLLADVRAAGHDRSALAVYVLLRSALPEVMAAVQRPLYRARRARWWRAAEVARFLAACPSLRWGHAWALALLCGLRRGELAGLRWADVDLRDQTISISNQRLRISGQGVIDAPPKSEAGFREIPIPEYLVALLRLERRRQLASGAPSSYVVCCLDGRPIDPGRLDRQLAADVQAVGLRPVGLHSLRHSMATMAISTGVPLRVLQDLLGHASVTTTAQIYSHVSNEAKRAAVTGISALATQAT